MTKNSVTLVWTRPKNDGGSKIIGYYVEAMRVPGDMWIRCNTSSQNVPREEYTVTGLERDLQYQFRVIAKTAVNISKPSEPTDPILVCAENGERVSFNILRYDMITTLMYFQLDYATKLVTLKKRNTKRGVSH